MKTIKFEFIINKTELKIPFKAICYITNKEFSGKITIIYRNAKIALEYVDVEMKIVKFTSVKTTAEELCREIYLAIKKVLDKTEVNIEVNVESSQAHQPVIISIGDSL